MGNRFYFLTLVFFVLLLGFLSYRILEPFLFPIAWAVVFSVLFYPAYAFILRYIKSKSITSLIVLVVILLIIIGPFSYLFFLLVKEFSALTEYAESGKIEALTNITGHPMIRSVISKVASLFNIPENEINKAIMDNISRLGKELVGGITKGAGGIITITLDFILMAISIFFLLRDGPGFLEKIRDYIPFSEEQKNGLVKQIEDILVSTMYGGVIVAIVQGTMGGVAFAVLGISSPVMWGLAMAIASFVPMVGPFAIWAPAAVYLFIEGLIWKGIVLVFIGAFGISLVDNILKPLIIGKRTKMPFLPLFFSVLGGIKLFGLIGFIMGPLVLATFVSVVEIFRRIDTSANA
ncbi:MAG: AI-2E family transporter [Thermodesulfobacteriota bacterium]